MKITLILLFTLFCLALTAQEYDTTSAQKGEGIHALLRRFNMDTPYYLKDFIKLNQEIIGENDWLQVGQVYLLPRELKTEREIKEATENEEFIEDKIFEPDFTKVTIVDKKLAGAVFYIVSGHGGPDPGAMGKRSDYDMCEDEYAYDVSLRLYRNLLSHGAKVYMVIQDTNDGLRDAEILACDKDEICMNGISIPARQNMRLRQRVQDINNISKDISNDVYERAIVIHCDSRSTGQRVDVFFYHYSQSPKGKTLAYELLKIFDKKYAQHQPDRGYRGTVSTRSLYLINYTRPPTVYIELGNIQNYTDQIRFVKENNRQALANWLAEGIINDHDQYIEITGQK